MYYYFIYTVLVRHGVSEGKNGRLNQALVVLMLDSAIHQLNCYPADIKVLW